MPLTELYLYVPSRFILFVLVLTRISGLMMTAPIFGPREVPMRVRAMLTLGVALLVTPLQLHVQVGDPGNLMNLMVMMAGEAIIGLALGLGVMILFSGLQLTGQVIGQMSGAQLADVFDPSFDQSVPLYGRLMEMVALAVFVLIGGHREVMDALLATFAALPLGGGGFNPGLGEAIVAVLTQSFVLAIRAAAPAVVALLMSVLIMGLISRTLPQLNILAVGFSLNALLMLAVIAMSLGGIAWVFQDEVGPSLDLLREAVAASGNKVQSLNP